MSLTNLIPAPYRIVAVLMLISACIGFGYEQGVLRESDRRDAQELMRTRAAEQAFNRALASGKLRASAVIEWRAAATVYYRNWQERLKHENDTELAQCQGQPGTQAQTSLPSVLLSATWLSMYNAAWLPQLDDRGDSGRAVDALGEAGGAGGATVSPREVLDNVSINAQLCGEDRKRLDELIGLLNEMGVNEMGAGK